MAGDEDRPPSEHPVFPAVTPETEPRDHATLHASSGGEPPADVLPPDEPAVEAVHAPDPPPAEPAHRAAFDRSAETFGEPLTPQAPEAKRSAMPTILAVIGVILILLLGAGLYMLANPPASPALTAAVKELDAVKQRVAALEARPQVQPVDLSPVDKRITATEGDVGALKTALEQTTAKVDALKAALEQTTAKVDAVPSFAAPLAAVQASVTALDGKVTSLEGNVAAIPKLDLSPIDARLDGIDKRFVPLEAYFNAPKDTVQATEARQNGSAAETRAAPIAVIAQGVLAAIGEGHPFVPEVEALAKLGVDPALLAPLRAVADKGAATRGDLVAGFAAVQDAAVVAAAPVETGTFVDRMFANAQTIVKVTHTGAAAGPDAGAIVSRIDAALKRGDINVAFAEWIGLPEASKAKSAEWGARLQARISAEMAARSIADHAVAALAAAQ